MAFNIAPDEIQIPRISLDRCHLDSRELEETSIGNYSGHAPTASRLRTELTDRAGLTKPKHRLEYFPNLPEPKGFSHGLPASRRQKFSRRRETQRHECIDEYGFQSRGVSRGSWRVEAPSLSLTTSLRRLDPISSLSTETAARNIVRVEARPQIGEDARATKRHRRPFSHGLGPWRIPHAPSRALPLPCWSAASLWMGPRFSTSVPVHKSHRRQAKARR
jgi:hypothetical protein